MASILSSFICCCLLWSLLTASSVNHKNLRNLLESNNISSGIMTFLGPSIMAWGAPSKHSMSLMGRSPLKSLKLTPLGPESPKIYSFSESDYFIMNRSKFVVPKKENMDLSDVRNVFNEYSRFVVFTEPMVYHALKITKIFQKYNATAQLIVSESRKQLLDELLAAYEMDQSLDDSFLFTLLLTGLIFRNHLDFRSAVELLCQINIHETTAAKFSRTVFSILFSSNFTIDELRLFFPSFSTGPNGFLTFVDFVKYLKTFRYSEQFVGIRGHLDYAFSLVDLSHSTIDTCLEHSHPHFDISMVSHLFHSFLRNEAVSDKALQDGISKLLKIKRMKLSEIASIGIVASYFRPSCFAKLFRHCMVNNILQVLLPYVDYSQILVFRAIDSNLRSISIESLHLSIRTASSLNYPCDHLLYFLSKIMRIEDYLVQVMKKENSDTFGFISNSLSMISFIDHEYMAGKLHLKIEEASEFLKFCSGSPLLSPFPRTFLPILAAQQPRVLAGEMSVEAAQNDIIASALMQVPFESHSVTSYMFYVGIASYAASDVRDLVDFLMESEYHSVLVRLAHFFRIENSYDVVSFEDSQKRCATLISLDDCLPALKILYDHEEFLVII